MLLSKTNHGIILLLMTCNLLGVAGGVTTDCPASNGDQQGVEPKECIQTVGFELYDDRSAGMCPDLTEVGMEECLKAAREAGTSIMRFKKDTLYVGSWNHRPCGCFIYKGILISYKDPSNGNCSPSWKSKLVCRKGTNHTPHIEGPCVDGVSEFDIVHLDGMKQKKTCEWVGSNPALRWSRCNNYGPAVSLGCPLSCSVCNSRLDPNIIYSTSGSFADSYSLDVGSLSNDLIAQLSPTRPTVAQILGFTPKGADVLVATHPSFNKICHIHGSDAHLRLLSGNFYFQTSSFDNPVTLKPGDEFLIPKGTPHIEGTRGSEPALFITTWNPLPDNLIDNFEFVDSILCNPDSIPKKKVFDEECGLENYTLPESWTATVLLHPFAPPPTTGPSHDNGWTTTTPFFQLSIADLFYNETLFEIHLLGCDEPGGSWYYQMYSGDPETVYVSRDGNSWRQDPELVGWRFPSRDWVGQDGSCSGKSPLNWAFPQDPVDWVKVPDVGLGKSSTWFWFDSSTGVPKRAMYGIPPPSPITGDVTKLPLLQMFSYSYFTDFTEVEYIPGIIPLTPPSIEGFTCGNVHSLPLIEWDSALSFSAMMVPVDKMSEPLPASVLYNWAAQPEQDAFSRVQVTQLSYIYNPTMVKETETAVLFGIGTNDPLLTGSGWLIDRNKDGTIIGNPICVLGEFIGQQPPNWAILGQGKVKANILPSTPLVGDTGRKVSVNSAVFPPIPPFYPDGTFLWTWYAVGGTEQDRPITFMQSASTIGDGTSLALADYFDFEDWSSLSPGEGIPITQQMGKYLKEKIEFSLKNSPQDCSSKVTGHRAANIDDVIWKPVKKTYDSSAEAS